MAKESDEVTAFFGMYPPAVRDVALELRRRILVTIPGAEEVLDRSARIVGYGFGSGYSNLVCTIIPSKTGVKLGLVDGVELPDPRGLLEGAGKRHRYVALKTLPDLKRPGLLALLRAGVALWKRDRVAAARTRRAPT